MLRATTASTFSSERPRVVRTCGVNILSWKSASRHNCLHFFEISTSKSGPNMWSFCHFGLEMCFAPQQSTLFRHSTSVNLFDRTSKSGVQTCGAFTILTWICASRHNSVHFFDISTSKSGPNMCFYTFDLDMCFAPQWRALFRRRNFQKWSEIGSFFTFLTWTHASRHNGVHILNISTLKSGLNVLCFVHFYLKMCFAPQQRALFRRLNFVRFDLEICFAPQRRAKFHPSSDDMAPHPPL